MKTMELKADIGRLEWISNNNEDEKDECQLLLEEKKIELKQVENLEVDFVSKSKAIMENQTPYSLVQLYKLCNEYDNESTHVFQKQIPSICDCCYNIMEVKSGMSICSTCGHFEQRLEKTVPKSNNKNEKSQYDPKDNFRSIVFTFQGKKSKRIPDFVYEKIDKALKKYHFDESSKKTMKKETLICILQENKLSDYYEDVNILYQHYTSIPPPDLSMYENEIFYRNSLVEEYFNNMDLDDRQNSLNNFFKLYVFLSMEGYKCNPDDFPILKTRNVVVYHNRTMKLICSKLKAEHKNMNWDFKPY